MKVLATGATGTFAGLVVPALIQHGLQVRAAVHNPGKAGRMYELGAQETVPFNLSDPASVDAALSGVDGAFLITPAFAPDATRWGLEFIQAARRAGVRKLVYSGVYHPSLPLENHAGTRPIETALYASGLDFTILQPAMFLQGLDGAWRQGRGAGTLVMPWSKHSRMSYVDYRDVADVAALAFTDQRLSDGTFELATEAVDRVQLAQLFTEASGTLITAEDMPVGALPPGLPSGLSDMFADYGRHGFHGGNSLVLQAVLGRAPRSIADYVAALVDASLVSAP